MPKLPRHPSLERLNALEPDVTVAKPGTIIWRLYFRQGTHPTNWRDFRWAGPTDARFDHHLEGDNASPTRGVLYAAFDPITCFAEVFQRRRVINRWDREPWLVGFEVVVAVPLLDLMDTFPTRAGASMALMTGPRSVSRAWARALYETYPQTAGLRYPSSMHGNRPAVVLTERALATLPFQPIFHRSLGDPAILSFLKNGARVLGFALS